jgi:uroporphyrin-III C-methyltransferase/precorrin-2 dehydrogenase/sirohydrochlorin ferrochelatase
VFVTYYPVSLQLHGRKAVVIADGAIAEEKALALLGAGAHVVVIGISPTRAVETLAAQSRLVVERRAYRPGDLDGAFLAIVSNEDPDVHRAVWRDAERRGVLLNAVDDTRHCHFIAPAIHRQGDITVAVSTAGTSPALAVRLRDAIARVVRPEHGRAAALFGAMRAAVAARVPDAARRRRLWFDIVDSDVFALLRRGRDGEARARINEFVAAASGDSGGRPHGATIGSVTLVGAGPGRPGLLTVAGLRALRRADAVVYDRLVHPALVRAAPARAKRIFVGKRAGVCSVSQEQINDTLIQLARAGHTVVRLKGGDPFVFGRGAEECAAVRAAGIQCAVISGVTSAIAAPAAAGIPVTHREHASAFAVITAAQGPSSPPVDWSACARMPTLVVLMGLQRLGPVLDRLRAHGVDPRTPAAMIANATLRQQRTVTGTVETLERLVADARLAGPATLIVGQTVRLADAAADGPTHRHVLADAPHD